jgi:hypothetical protein
VIDIEDVIDALKTKLDAVAAQTGPYGRKRFDVVVTGVGLQAPDVSRLAAVWWDGEDSEEETLANVMTTHRFGVVLAWVARSAQSETKRLDVEMADTLRAVKTALRADSTLGGLITRLTMTPASRVIAPLADGVAVGGQAAPLYHQLLFDVLVDDYEGEAVNG